MDSLPLERRCSAVSVTESTEQLTQDFAVQNEASRAEAPDGEDRRSPCDAKTFCGGSLPDSRLRRKARAPGESAAGLHDAATRASGAPHDPARRDLRIASRRGGAHQSAIRTARPAAWSTGNAFPAIRPEGDRTHGGSRIRMQGNIADEIASTILPHGVARTGRELGFAAAGDASPTRSRASDARAGVPARPRRNLRSRRRVDRRYARNARCSITAFRNRSRSFRRVAEGDGIAAADTALPSGPLIIDQPERRPR